MCVNCIIIKYGIHNLTKNINQNDIFKQNVLSNFIL